MAGQQQAMIIWSRWPTALSKAPLNNNDGVGHWTGDRRLRRCDVKAVGLALVMFVVGFCALASAQDKTVDRTAKGEAGKNLRVGVYVNVQPDCTSGPLPTIRLSSAPAHGKVTVRKGKVRATNYKQCLALEVEGYVAFYKSNSDFSGNDVFILEVKFPSGRTEIQRFTVTIAAAGASRA
jgi:hypothetical protein